MAPCPKQPILRFIALAAMLAGPGLAAAQSDYSAAQAALFDTPHLANVTEPTTLHYDYSRDGAGEPVRDEVEVVVTEILADGRRTMEFGFLTGPRRLNVPPIRNFRGNPLIMVFLERDVRQMSEATGGSALYFRNRIRSAFADRAETDRVDFAFDGRKLTGTRVTLSPFLKDPRLVHFPPLDRKSYEFLLSADVPGGVYRIRTTTPGGSGQQPVEETVSFRDAVP